MTVWTPPQHVTAGDASSSQYNAEVADNLQHLFDRIVAGTHDDAGDGTPTKDGTVTFGVTFAAAPVVAIGALFAGTNDIGINIRATPTTTGFNYRMFSNNGGNITAAFTIHWIAFGTPL